MTIQEAQQLRYGAQQSKVYPDWISVSDRLPEWGDFILVCIHKMGKNYPSIYEGYLEGDKWYYITTDGALELKDFNADYLSITHWMPLPPAPCK